MSLISYLTRIHFADRVLEDALAVEMARQGIGRPLVISEREASGGEGLDRLFCALPLSAEAAGYVAGSAAPPQDRARAAEMLEHADCDGVIGFGGRAALDLARLVGSARRPVIAIPTGTETVGLGPLGRTAPVSPRHKRSHTPRHQHGHEPGRQSRPQPGQGPGYPPGQQARLPAAILCDATLTTGRSPAETAAAGMDALCHCLECFLGTAFNPPADGIALDGLRRAGLHLERAVQEGGDIAARRELLAAALDAGLASEKGCGGIEAASNGLEPALQAGDGDLDGVAHGGLQDITPRALHGMLHGALHGALIAQVLAFNAPAVAGRFDLIRSALALPAGADPGERLARLAERVGLPLRLSEVGIAEHMLGGAARRAAADPANRTNPRHATAEDYERMMHAAL